uniref:histidinol-phosphatase HisJ family protein n=1 Tax=uncultured Meiothermus sp. TaxID=157471 RepID=UPI002631181F
PLCKHAVGAPAEYVQAAKDAGLHGIVMTDHSPMPAWFDPEVRMEQGELPFYHTMMEKVRAEAGGFYVGIGLEADFHPGTEYFVRRLRLQYEYDYLIGSVHHLGCWPFDNPRYVAEFEERDTREIYLEYFKLVVRAARSGLFHSIGHLDLPKVMGFRPSGGYVELAEEALQTIAGEGLALDVNTAGWRKKAAEIYPSAELLARASQLQIPVVLGSDAHRPEEVAHRFADAVGLLKSVGYTQAVVFRAGNPAPYAL